MYVKRLAQSIWTAVIALSCSTLLVGAGNPVLLISSGSNPFSGYASEILKAEGIAFDNADLTALSATLLAPYDIAVLGHVTLTSTDVQAANKDCLW